MILLIFGLKSCQDKGNESQVGALCLGETLARLSWIHTLLCGQGSWLPLLLKEQGWQELVTMG